MIAYIERFVHDNDVDSMPEPETAEEQGDLSPSSTASTSRALLNSPDAAQTPVETSAAFSCPSP
ncbi:UNVERIFIED_CONTAM: hypothetical protein Sangu_1610000 [Sesamum angustifolium]|uniref:Uncharacterized protein n=1 Tax=Sesamum angustifolium TaxID=2727405 RepID=A0AAW2MGR0_9LAMI